MDCFPTTFLNFHLFSHNLHQFFKWTDRKCKRRIQHTSGFTWIIKQLHKPRQIEIQIKYLQSIIKRQTLSNQSKETFNLTCNLPKSEFKVFARNLEKRNTKFHFQAMICNVKKKWFSVSLSWQYCWVWAASEDDILFGIWGNGWDLYQNSQCCLYDADLHKLPAESPLFDLLFWDGGYLGRGAFSIRVAFSLLIAEGPIIYTLVSSQL